MLTQPVNLIGSSNYGFQISLPLSEDQVNQFLSNTIARIRIYTTDGYAEADVKDKFQTAVAKALKLVN